MMKIVKRIALAVGLLSLVGFVLIGGLFMSTQGEYTVPETVLTDPTLPQVEIDGVRFHAETFGEPTQPVVVVVHGGPGGDYGYLLNLHQLANDYFVVFYDQQGAGLSPRVAAETLTLQSAVDDLHRVVQHYGEGRPVRLIGHSWGGMLAAAYVGQHPEQVTQAVLAEPGALDNAGLARFLARQTSEQSVAYYRLLVPTIFESMHLVPPDEQARQDYIFGKMSAGFVDSAASGYRCAGDEGVTAVLPAVSVPPSRFGAVAYQTLFGETADLSPIAANAPRYKGDVLFLASECSAFSGAELQAQQMTIFPQATLAVVPDAGHEMFGENPDESIRLVRDFFAGGAVANAQ